VANQEKTAAVAEITERFQGASAAVLTEYRGLTMAQLTQLRRSLGSETTYAVVKNTLTKRAASEAGFPVPDDLLTGPTAIAFISGDPVEAAKGLRDFSRTHPLLVIKGGVLEGRALSPEEVRQLADVEPREVLLAKLAGAMQGSLSKAAGLFQAPLSQVARLAAALQEKKGEAGDISETAAADAPATTDDTVTADSATE
jgi:large subunit ribosomal protein L10